MAYWIYSTESLPNQNLMGKPGYTPEYIAFAGIQLNPLDAKTWTKLPDRWINIVHRDWKDKRGTREVIQTEDILKAVSRFADRGVVIVDHEPTATEKASFEKKSEEANMAFRMRAIEWYENQVREKEVTGHGRTHPTPYENECYDALGLVKPYSVEAMRAQRHPGEAVGEQIVSALERIYARRNSQKPAESAK